MNIPNIKLTKEHPISGRKIVLVKATDSDIKHLIMLAQDPDLIDVMGWDTSFSLDDVKGFTDALSEYALPFSQPSQSVVFSVFLESEASPIGYGALKGFNLDLRSVETGVAILDRRYRKKGYGRLTLQCMVDYAFNELNIQKIAAAILSSNKTSVNMCKRSGFLIKEVMHNSWTMPDGRLADMVWMEIDRE